MCLIVVFLTLWVGAREIRSKDLGFKWMDGNMLFVVFEVVAVESDLGFKLSFSLL